MKVVPSGFLRVLKTLVPPEFIRLRGRIKAANKDVLLSALGQNPRWLRTFSVTAGHAMRKRSITGWRCLNKRKLGINVAPRCALVFSAPWPV